MLRSSMNWPPGMSKSSAPPPVTFEKMIDASPRTNRRCPPVSRDVKTGLECVAWRVWSAASATGMGKSRKSPLPPTVIPSSRRIPLPRNANGPRDEREWNSVPAGKSFVAVWRGDGGKASSSPAAGATSPAQFCGLVQLSSAPPPSHVRTDRTLVRVTSLPSPPM
jgi:hypothetical protein